ncbi:MAG: hypothetical protein SOY65_09700 [Marinifilaceae bacterium]|nr:hypothetical protein [Marinifilaceae bacterium]
MCRNQLKNSIALFLLVLFLGYYGNITFFTHVHVVSGKIIIHSHFYWDGEEDDVIATHGHSRGEYAAIQKLTHFTSLQPTVVADIPPLRVVRVHYYVQKRIERPELLWRWQLSSRGPPVFSWC